MVVIVLLLFGGFGFGMGSFGGGMMGSYYGFGWLFTIIFFAALILLMVWLFNQLKTGDKR